MDDFATSVDGINDLNIGDVDLCGLPRRPTPSPVFEEQDYETIRAGNVGLWSRNFQAENYIESLEDLGQTMLEHLVTEAYLRIRVRAVAISPLHSLGRIVMVNYLPWAAPDPPVPLLIWFPRSDAVDLHYRAIRALLSGDNSAGRLMLQALGENIFQGIDCWTQMEVYYYWVKMRSLIAGTHTLLQGKGRLRELPSPNY